MPVEEQFKDNLIPRFNRELEFPSEGEFTSERKIMETEKKN